MSGNGNAAAVARAKFYARTRPTPVVRLTPNRALNGVEAAVVVTATSRKTPTFVGSTPTLIASPSPTTFPGLLAAPTAQVASPST